jgi:peptidoglycan lytic transglycosylase
MMVFSMNLKNKAKRQYLMQFCTVTAALLFSAACSWVPKGEVQLDVGLKDRGVASWYGEQFHGKQAANGELFDMEALTAAHRTLPLGSMIRVVNLVNGKHVHVRINDRGPYVNGRILDLSHAAAAYLGMVKGGLSVVQIEVVGERRPDLLVPSDVQEILNTRFLIQSSAQVGVPDEAGSVEFNCPDPFVAQPLRLLPGDVLIQRRFRRVPAILAADHTAHTQVAALIID